MVKGEGEEDINLIIYIYFLFIFIYLFCVGGNVICWDLYFSFWLIMVINYYLALEGRYEDRCSFYLSIYLFSYCGWI